MGDVGTYIEMLMRARQDIINKNYNYHALVSAFVIQEDAQAPIEREKTPWSRIHDRIFMRFIAPGGALNDGVIQIRILDGHSQHQQPSDTTSVTEARHERGADACPLSGSVSCNQVALDTFEGLAGPKLAQVALANSFGPYDLTPTVIAQEPIPIPPPIQIPPEVVLGHAQGRPVGLSRLRRVFRLRHVTRTVRRQGQIRLYNFGVYVDRDKPGQKTIDISAD